MRLLFHNSFFFSSNFENVKRLLLGVFPSKPYLFSLSLTLLSLFYFNILWCPFLGRLLHCINAPLNAPDHQTAKSCVGQMHLLLLIFTSYSYGSSNCVYFFILVDDQMHKYSHCLHRNYNTLIISMQAVRVLSFESCENFHMTVWSQQQQSSYSAWYSFFSHLENKHRVLFNKIWNTISTC